ncbi:MAG TPA: helix-turn-helix transcriptional regulator [Ignavibacteria bacterium]
MKIEQAFGEVLKKYRLQLHISQEELAHQSGLDRTFISLLERGKRKPTLNTVFSICKCLKNEPHIIIQEVEKLIYENNEKDNIDFEG